MSPHPDSWLSRVQGMLRNRRKDYSDEARAVFPEVAKRRRLTACFENNPHVEVVFGMPKQDLLDFSVTLCLQNSDELWLYVADYSFCMFPFDKYVNEFMCAVDGLIVGTHRVLSVSQTPWALFYRHALQKADGPKWVDVALSGSIIPCLPFFRIEEVILQNRRWSESR